MKINSEEILGMLMNCDFSEGIDELNMEACILDNIDEPLEDWAYGATKLVLIPRDADYVIKIPFNKDEGGKYFEYANIDDNHSWDYCSVDLKIYNYARQAGIQCALAKPFFVGYVQDYPIYAQQKARKISHHDSASAQEQEKLNVYYKHKPTTYSLLDCDWEAKALSYYGEKFFKNLLNFIVNQDVNDLNLSNIGFIGERPVLIDYSSYNEW